MHAHTQHDMLNSSCAVPLAVSVAPAVRLTGACPHTGRVAATTTTATTKSHLLVESGLIAAEFHLHSAQFTLWQCHHSSAVQLGSLGAAQQHAAQHFRQLLVSTRRIGCNGVAHLAAELSGIVIRSIAQEPVRGCMAEQSITRGPSWVGLALAWAWALGNIYVYVRHLLGAVVNSYSQAAMTGCPAHRLDCCGVMLHVPQQRKRWGRCCHHIPEIAVQVIHTVLDGCATQAPAVSGHQRPCRMSCERPCILNCLRLVQHNTVPGHTEQRPAINATATATAAAATATAAATAAAATGLLCNCRPRGGWCLMGKCAVRCQHDCKSSQASCRHCLVPGMVHVHGAARARVHSAVELPCPLVKQACGTHHQRATWQEW